MYEWAGDCTYNKTMARKVLLYILSKVDHKPCRTTFGHTHEYTPTQARSANDAGKTENAVKKAIQRLKKVGTICYMLETYCEEVDGRKLKRTRIKDHWQRCGSPADYANEKNDRSCLMTPIPKQSIFPKDMTVSMSEKQETANRMTSVIVQEVGLREMKHVIALANKHGYKFGSDGTIETCLDWLGEKSIYGTLAIEAVLTAPNLSYAWLNENFNRLNGRRLTLGLVSKIAIAELCKSERKATCVRPIA